MTYSIQIIISASAATLAAAAEFVTSFEEDAPSGTFEMNTVIRSQNLGGLGGGMAGGAVSGVAEQAQQRLPDVAPKPKVVNIKKATKPVADPDPAPASTSEPLASPAKAPTHTELVVALRAILVPVATTGTDGSKRVTQFIRAQGHTGTVDTIPTEKLSGIIAAAQKEFA